MITAKVALHSGRITLQRMRRSVAVSYTHLDVYKRQALCDLNEELLDRESKKYGIKKAFRVFEDMLADDIDAVVIATPCLLYTS